MLVVNVLTNVLRWIVLRSISSYFARVMWMITTNQGKFREMYSHVIDVIMKVETYMAYESIRQLFMPMLPHGAQGLEKVHLHMRDL